MGRNGPGATRHRGSDEIRQVAVLPCLLPMNTLRRERRSRRRRVRRNRNREHPPCLRRTQAWRRQERQPMRRAEPCV